MHLSRCADLMSNVANTTAQYDSDILTHGETPRPFPALPIYGTEPLDTTPYAAIVEREAHVAQKSVLHCKQLFFVHSDFCFYPSVSHYPGKTFPTPVGVVSPTY